MTKIPILNAFPLPLKKKGSTIFFFPIDWVNAANYYCLNNGGINLGNYEAQFDYFPINFKDDFQQPIDQKEWVQAVHWKAREIDICGYAEKVDYILIWGDADKITAESLKDCYQLISSKGRLKLYKGKRGSTS